jgi:hypothetical protein
MLSEEIKREDRKIFFREFFQLRRLILMGIWIGFSLGVTNTSFVALAPLLAGFAAHIGFSESAARRKRFKTERFALLWNGCRDRFFDFKSGVKKLDRAGVVTFEDLPSSIEKLSMNLYNALRRADLMFVEIEEVEGKSRFQPGVPMVPPVDAQTQALYQQAERTIGEYKNSYNELIAGIQRTEAQATVFIHTLDVLRVKMHGYRLIGKDPSLGSQELLSALAEAKVTLQSIDTALDELDLSVYPTTISVVPHSIPEQTAPMQIDSQQLREGHSNES